MNNNSHNKELLQSFLNYLEFEKRSSKHTVSSYKTDLLQFLTSISTIKIEEISDKSIRLWIAELSEDKISPKSINRKITAIHSFYNFLQKINIVIENPAQKIRALKTKKRLPTFVEQKNINNLLDNIEFENNFVGLRDRFIIVLLYTTGIRRAELINLSLQSFDFSNTTIKVLGKRNKERLVPIVAECTELAKRYILERNKITQSHNYLIITESGAKAYDNLIYRIVKKYISQVSTIEKKSPHVLRHSFATHLLNNGADLNDIKELLGHSNLSATQIYTHNSFEKLKDIYKQSHPRN